MSAHDCPPDVAVCVGGEAFVSVGGAHDPAEPCRQLSLGACEHGCVAEGVPIALVGRAPEAIHAQVCQPARDVVLGHPVAASGGCAAGESVCADGIVQICGKGAARCERGCATDDTIDGEDLSLEQALGLFCRR